MRIAMLAIGLAACGSIELEPVKRTMVSTYTVTFNHAGFTAGPAVFTDATGAVVEERRYEPFGAPIDAADFVPRDLNALNKRTDYATGWSDHGARWMAPETARWLSPDPPVEGPNADYMAAPWALHPYQYVNQNPIAFWDPKGTCSAPMFLAPGEVGICIEAFIAAPRVQVLGAGDDRGHAANDPGKTNRIEQDITVDLKTFDVDNTTYISKSGPSGFGVAMATGIFGLIGGGVAYFSGGIRGTGDSSVRDQVIDRTAGTTTFVAGGFGRNGAQRIPLLGRAAPGGSIDYTFRFQVNAKGDVTLLNGDHKAFPSYGVYAYKVDANDNIVPITLHQFDEIHIDALKASFPDGMTDAPKSTSGVGVHF
jgi:RHS repeat-associated protein